MIFNNVGSSSASLEAVKESPYECGYYGALMHIYETQNNYNMMMKAAAISELKYYEETGGDLFVQEAGALAGFIEKAKKLFKAVIEKIKAIFKKFVTTINSYTMKDKDFVKKYTKDLRAVKYDGLEFEGYKFNIDAVTLVTDHEHETLAARAKTAASKGTTDTSTNVGSYADKVQMNSDELADEKDKNRGKMIGKGPLTKEELRDELKQAFYGGDKETLKITGPTAYLDIISNTQKDIQKAQKDQDTIVKAIEAIIKDIEKAQKVIGDGSSNDKNDTALGNRNAAISVLNQDIDIYKSESDDYVAYYGMKVQALKDQNRQAKAICVKALNYKPKNESAYTEGSYADIFAGVNII